MSGKGGNKHEDEKEKRRESDGNPGPINPDTIREHKPGKRGK